MPRNKSEKHPFAHVPPKYVERLRLYALWKRAEGTVGGPNRAKAREAKAAYVEYRHSLSDTERSAYFTFQGTTDFGRLKTYSMERYGA